VKIAYQPIAYPAEYGNAVWRHESLAGRPGFRVHAMVAAIQHRHQVGAFRKDRVVNGEGARHQAHAALFRATHAEKRSDIYGIDVEIERERGTIGAARVARMRHVHDLPDDVASVALCDGLPHVRAEAPENEVNVFAPVPVDRQTAEQGNAGSFGEEFFDYA
jgi:hypothetical protein